MYISVALRELRVAAANPAIYRSRTCVAAMGMIALGWSLAAVAGSAIRSPFLVGQTTFTVGAWSVFLMAALSGVSATADAISSEKRAGTLGLLFLTRLKGGDVVLGKLFVCGLSAFCGLLALLPPLTIPVLLGGVEFSQCVRLVVSVINMLLLSEAVGLLASSFCVKEQEAHAKSLPFLLLVAAAPPLVGAGLRRLAVDPAVCLGIELISPVFTLRSALGALTGPQMFWFWVSAVIVLSASGTILMAAAWVAPRRWQEGTRAGLWSLAAARLSAAVGGTIRTRELDGRKLLEENPWLWLATRNREAFRMTWITMGLVVLGTFLAYGRARIFWPPEVAWLLVWVAFALVLLKVLKGRLSNQAVIQIAEAKENGTLPLILASRVGMQEIVRGQFRAAFRQSAFPFAVVAGMICGALAASAPGLDWFAENLTASPEFEMLRFRAWLLAGAMVLFLFWDARCIVWVALRCAFQARSAVKARGWSGFWGIAFADLVFMALVVLLLNLRSTRDAVAGFYPLLVLWLLIKGGTNLALTLLCRRWLDRLSRVNAAAPKEAGRDQDFWPDWIRVRIDGLRRGAGGADGRQTRTAKTRESGVIDYGKQEREARERFL